jgi:hypothetical protein
MNWKIIAAIVVIVAIGGLGWYLQRGPQEPQVVAVPPPEPMPLPRAEKSAPAEQQEPLVAAPATLDNSDAQVRTAVTDFAPKLAEWLTPREQIRKWVMLVNQVAEGKLPLKDRPLQYSMPGFMVERSGQTLRLDPANYARANAVIDTIVAIPPQRLAQYYHAWRPTLDKAYGELGGSDGFDKRLRAAIDRVLKARTLSAAPTLSHPSVYYQYADPKLEQADDVEKLLWRLGPGNTKRIQDYLRQLLQEL